MPTLEIPLWMQGGTYTGDQDQSLLDNLWGNEGVINVGDLAVTQNHLGADMHVDIASGIGIVIDDNASVPGKYLCRHLNGPTQVLLTTAPGTGQSRIDLIVLKVRDNAEDAGGNNDFLFDKVTGTPATTGSQVAPALPNSCLKLGSVLVGPNVSTIVNANITDTRVRAFMLGTIVICTSATRPGSPWAGLTCYETDTGALSVYNGTAWKTLGRQLPVHTRVYQATSFSTATALTTLVPNTVDYDDTASYSAGTFTAPYTGYLKVTGRMEVTATGAGQWLQTFLYKGGVLYAKGTTGIAGASGNIIDSALPTTVKVTAGDLLTFRYNCSNILTAAGGSAALYWTIDGALG